jgi:NodT family efflux transporter outer membrane factor (OMF) lipoprotein
MRKAHTSNPQRSGWLHPDLVKLVPIALVTFVLAGCATGGAGAFPGLIGPPKVKSQARDAITSFRDLPPPPAGDTAAWWARFSDPVLDTLVREALTESISVRVANQRLIEARNTGLATIAGYAPRLNGSLSTDTNYVEEGPKLVTTNGAQVDQQTSQISAARASWEVPLFGRGLSAFVGARANNALAKADLEASKIAIIGDIAAGYVELRNAQLSVAYLQDDLVRAQRLANVATVRSNAGLISLSEASQAQTQAAAIGERLPDAILRMRGALDRLAILRGVMPGSLDQTLAPIDDFAFKTEAPLVDSVPANFIRRRLDVKRAEQNAVLAAAQVGISRADLYPSLSISGTISQLASLAGGGFVGDIRQGGVTPALDIPLFAFGQRRAALTTSNAQFQQALLQYRSATLNAVGEGQAALTGYDQARNRAMAGLETERAAAVRNNATRAAYEAGISSFKDRLEAERDFASARQTRLSTQAQYSEAAIGLYRTFAGAPGL